MTTDKNGNTPTEVPDDTNQEPNDTDQQPHVPPEPNDQNNHAGSDVEDFEKPTKSDIPPVVVGSKKNADGEYLDLHVPSIELPDGVTVDPVDHTSSLSELTTKQLRKELKRIQKNLNTTADVFIAAHRQCTNYRDKYYGLAVRHAQISQHIHIRESLRITGTLKRELTQDELNLISGQKLRSGSKLSIKQPTTMQREEHKSFNFDSYAMMQDFKHNVEQHEKCHSKRKMCITQQYAERCAVCHKFFRTKEGLNSHLMGHTKTYYMCPLCKDKDGSDRPFTALKAFRFHLKWHKLGEPYYTCEICGVKKEWPKYLESHMTTHRKPERPCRAHPGCEAMFSFEQERKYHERYGNILKIYRCDECPMKFKDHVKLTIHQGRIHNPLSKHYKPRQRLDTSNSQAVNGHTENVIVDDPNLPIPLFPDLSVDSENAPRPEGNSSTLDTSTSEYRPTNASYADAQAEESEDDRTLPDV